MFLIQWSLRPLDLHDVFAQVLDAAGKGLVDHRFGERLEHGHVHGAVEARRVAGLVVLGPERDAVLVQRDQRLFECPGQGPVRDA